MQYFDHPEHTNFEQMEKSVERLFKVIQFTFDVRVLGGEPFVNVELFRFLDMFLRYSDQYAWIQVLTNATIIPNRRTLDALKNEKIVVRMSEYNNPKQKIKELAELFNDNGILYYTEYIGRWQKCSDIKFYNRTTVENIEQLKRCVVRNVPVIVDGKFFRCPLAGNAFLLSAMPSDCFEYVNLLDENTTVDELRDNILLLNSRNYLKACNYCGNRCYVGNDIAPAIQAEHPLSYRKYS
jgi:hypothetical protein